MNSGEAHKIWIEQCEAAQTIRARFGLNAAFDYVVGEKLMNFASAACQHPEFAEELPHFISKVRTMFTQQELAAQLTRIERELNEKDPDIPDEVDAFDESPAATAVRVRQFTTIRELLTATALGTS